MMEPRQDLPDSTGKKAGGLPLFNLPPIFRKKVISQVSFLFFSLQGSFPAGTEKFLSNTADVQAGQGDRREYNSFPGQHRSLLYGYKKRGGWKSWPYIYFCKSLSALI